MAWMRRLGSIAIAAALAVGCAGSVAHVHVAVELTGAGAGGGEQQRCLDAVQQAGGVVDAGATLRALVTVEPSGNRVQLLSQRRGLVHDQLEPQAPVEQLCKEAVAAAVRAARREPLPVTALDEASPNSRRSMVPSDQASGAPSHGPISDQ